MKGAADDSGIRLAELVATFTLAVDLGLGQPMEHVLRSWLIAARLGDHVGIKRDERGALYYVATLAWVGCVADTPELSAWFGDDIAYRHDGYELDQTVWRSSDSCSGTLEPAARLCNAFGSPPISWPPDGVRSKPSSTPTASSRQRWPTGWGSALRCATP